MGVSSGDGVVPESSPLARDDERRMDEPFVELGFGEAAGQHVVARDRAVVVV
jgi:hypothetical protein